QVAGVHFGRLEGASGRAGGHVDQRLVLRGVAARADARAGPDPLVAGVEHLADLVVGDHALGPVDPEPEHRGRGRARPLADGGHRGSLPSRRLSDRRLRPPLSRAGGAAVAHRAHSAPGRPGEGPPAAEGPESAGGLPARAAASSTGPGAAPHGGGGAYDPVVAAGGRFVGGARCSLWTRGVTMAVLTRARPEGTPDVVPERPTIGLG